jgi:hypothetical protein
MVVKMLSGSHRIHQFLGRSFFIFITAPLFFYQVRTQRSQWE